MFKHPFDSLGGPQLNNPQGEEVEGAFTCQTCYDVVPTARYLLEVKLLTWKCNSGHVSKIEGFNLD